MNADDLWRAYQLGQISADHTPKQVFCEVINPVLARLAEAEALLREAREELNSWMYYGHGSRTSGFGSAPLCNRIEEVTHE